MKVEEEKAHDLLYNNCFFPPFSRRFSSLSLSSSNDNAMPDVESEYIRRFMFVIC
jgi:hypothetical protein